MRIGQPASAYVRWLLERDREGLVWDMGAPDAAGLFAEEECDKHRDIDHLKAVHRRTHPLAGDE